ncbi:hypothetical protein KY284_020331 [Solanum tuberosum]|nr:hypothetical protein KY284_020331 [Solanum tuberosum]
MIQKVFKARRYIENVGINVTDFMGMHKFSIKKMYKLLLGDLPKVSWRKMVCNNMGCPKWKFILWLALKGRLQTKDKLGQWMREIDKGITRSNQGWMEEVQWAQQHCKGRSKGASVYKMVLVVAVYQVWKERNNRIFQNSSRSQHVIIKQIMQEVFQRASRLPVLVNYMRKLDYYPV